MSKKVMVKLSKKQFNIDKLIWLGLFILFYGLILFVFCLCLIVPTALHVFYYWIWLSGITFGAGIAMYKLFIPNFLNIFSSYKRYSRKIDEEIELENFDTKYWYQEKTIYLD